MEIDSVMEVNGFESSEVLDTRVRAVVDGGAAEQWDKLSKTIDLTNAIDRAIYTVVALSSVGGTATVGTLVVAGAMIALATDRIYMRPGSVIGAATPVNATGERAPEKIVSAMRSAM